MPVQCSTSCAIGPEFLRPFSLLPKQFFKCNDQIHSFQSAFRIHGKFLYYHHKLYSFNCSSVQVNSAFCAHWLTLDYTVKSVTPEHRAARETLKIDHFQLIVKDNEFGAMFSIPVVYTKTTIHLGVGGSGGYLAPPQ